MSTSDLIEAADTSARFLFNPHFLGVFKGFTLTTIAPIILIVIFTVIVVNLLAYLLADSPGPYPHYGKKLAIAAADMWERRNEYGFPTGRNLNTLGPLENILDAISTSIKKYEGPIHNDNRENYTQETAASGPTNFIQASPQFLTKPSYQNQKLMTLEETPGKVRFE